MLQNFTDASMQHPIDVLNVCSNIFFHDQVSPTKIPEILNSITVGMIPYRKTRFTTYCYPMKLFEYFFMGIPVVTTPIKELARFSEYVKI
jgi:glycosyltransferase involved in cell wall biosynthesis